MLLVLCEPIDTEFFVVAKCQLANHRAQRHLRRFDVHFVEDLFHLHDHLAIAKDDDRVGALIGNELGVPDRDCLGHGVHRLRGKLLGNIK